ncbi:protein FAM180A [Hypomesus transpacificus]|uniref:protein FAM180A n=1 Tax=Hypomesus transpacificus TaxID=137520 RepID=UPI001F072E6E|nr:protein FAM180A [Hypomesus transpacificus]
MATKLQFGIVIHMLLGLWIYELFTEEAAAQHGGLASQGFRSTIEDTNLMFELLLGGLEIDQDNNIRLLDQEMASMRQGRAFLALVNDNIPKTLLSMEQLLDTLEGQKKPLSTASFQSLVMGMIYTAHQTKQQEREDKQQAWGSVLFRLANVTVNALRRQDHS